MVTTDSPEAEQGGSTYLVLIENPAANEDPVASLLRVRWSQNTCNVPPTIPTAE